MICFQLPFRRRHFFTNESANHDASLRAATTLVEIMVSCVLISGLVALVLPMTMRVARQRLVHREILVANHELMNQMERLTRLSAEDLAETHIEISTMHQRVLPDAKLVVDLTKEESDRTRIQLTLHWTNRLGHRVAPQSLTAWTGSTDLGPSSEGAKP